MRELVTACFYIAQIGMIASLVSCGAESDKTTKASNPGWIVSPLHVQMVEGDDQFEYQVEVDQTKFDSTTLSFSMSGSRADMFDFDKNRAC